MTSSKSTDSVEPRPLKRRGFLAATGIAGIGALAGCTFNINTGDASGASGGPVTTAGGTTSGGSTTTPTGGETTTQEELVMITVEPEPIEAEFVTVEPTPTPEPLPSRFRIDNFRLTVNSADDGDVWVDDEELFGDIFVSGWDEGRRTSVFCTGRPEKLVWWTREPMVIEEGKSKKLNLDLRLDMPDLSGRDRDLSYIRVATIFWEDDAFDDTLSGSPKQHYLSDLTTPGATVSDELYLRNGGTEVVLSYDITPVN